MNQVFLRSDQGEYLPGETVCGAVYLVIRSPTEAHGVQLSFNGRESVCCSCHIDGQKTTLQASHDYIDYSSIDLFRQKEPFALGSYCFPFRLQIPYVLPGTFHASSSDPAEAWSASIAYRLRANILGADAMGAEQDVVIKSATAEALRDNYMTVAQNIRLPSTGFFARRTHITIKPLANYIRSGECVRLRMVVTNELKSRICTFGIKLIRSLTLTLPYKTRPSVDAAGDHEEDPPPSPSTQQHTVQVDGGRTVVREVVGDLSQYASLKLSSGGGLDNMMIPLKTTDGKSLMPSVQGKYIQCDYSLEVRFDLGDNKVQSVTCPLIGVLPVENDQWLSWKPLPWMTTTEVKLSEYPGPISPPAQMLGSEAFGRLPRFQVL